MTSISPPQTGPLEPPLSLAGWLWRVLLMAALAIGIGFVMDRKLELGTPAALAVAVPIFVVGLLGMLRLRGSPREMGIIFGLKLLTVTGYKILTFTLTVWLARDLGFDAAKAQLIVLAWSLFMTVSSVLVGSVTDAIGIRRTLVIGVSICVLMRLVMIATNNPLVALLGGLMPLAVGEALCTPVLVAAIRKYASPAKRSIAFSLFYALMNFGFALGYALSDGVNVLTKEKDVLIPVLEMSVSPMRLLIFVSMIFEMLMLPLVLLLRPNVRMTEQGILETTTPRNAETSGFTASIGKAARDTREMFRSLVASDGFHRLVIFLLMIGLLKVVFNVMDYVLPDFSLREIGEKDKLGRLNMVNSVLILVLAPLVGMATRNKSSYSMVVVGGFITAASFVFLALPPVVFQPVARGWLGETVVGAYLKITGTVHPYYVMIFLWQIVFSIGESFYSPRVYEYAASIAPKGQEASYSSLSYVPMLIGKLVTNSAFSWLLPVFCPAVGPRNSPAMWAIIGAMVLISPVGLWLLRSKIRVKEEGRD